MAFKTDRGVVTAIFLCAMVCSYCMSQQHLDAKIVKNFPLKCMGGNLLLNRLVNPYQSRYARGGIKRDRGVVTAIFHVCSGLLILHVSSTPRCLDSQYLPYRCMGGFP